MQPSSLIFVVVVVIWAAYLVHHWVRRREHLATARSMDRFSEALRVLERRSVLAGPGPSPAGAHSYAVSTASEGDARRGAIASSAPLRSPLRARSGSAAAAASAAVGAAATPPGPSRTRRNRPAARVVVRRLRGLAFLVTLAAVPATIVLSALQVLLWVSVVISFAAFGLVLAWLRVSRVRARAARRAGRASRDAAKGGRVPAQRHGIPDRRPGVGPDSSSSGLQAAVPDSGLGVASVLDATSARVAAKEAAEGGAVPKSAGEPADDGAWSPVPVPPPTYTLKDAAPREVPEPAPVTQVPVPIEVEDDDLERMAVDRLRRVVGG